MGHHQTPTGFRSDNLSITVTPSSNGSTAGPVTFDQFDLNLMTSQAGFLGDDATTTLMSLTFSLPNRDTSVSGLVFDTDTFARSCRDVLDVLACLGTGIAKSDPAPAWPNRLGVRVIERAARILDALRVLELVVSRIKDKHDLGRGLPTRTDLAAVDRARSRLVRTIVRDKTGFASLLDHIDWTDKAPVSAIGTGSTRRNSRINGVIYWILVHYFRAIRAEHAAVADAFVDQARSRVKAGPTVCRCGSPKRRKQPRLFSRCGIFSLPSSSSSSLSSTLSSSGCSNCSRNVIPNSKTNSPAAAAAVAVAGDPNEGEYTFTDPFVGFAEESVDEAGARRGTVPDSKSYLIRTNKECKLMADATSLVAAAKAYSTVYRPSKEDRMWLRYATTGHSGVNHQPVFRTLTWGTVGQVVARMRRSPDLVFNPASFPSPAESAAMFPLTGTAYTSSPVPAWKDSNGNNNNSHGKKTNPLVRDVDKVTIRLARILALSVAFGKLDHSTSMFDRLSIVCTAATTEIHKFRSPNQAGLSTNPVQALPFSYQPDPDRLDPTIPRLDEPTVPKRPILTRHPKFAVSGRDDGTSDQPVPRFVDRTSGRRAQIVEPPKFARSLRAEEVSYSNQTQTSVQHNNVSDPSPSRPVPPPIPPRHTRPPARSEPVYDISEPFGIPFGVPVVAKPARPTLRVDTGPHAPTKTPASLIRSLAPHVTTHRDGMNHDNNHSHSDMDERPRGPIQVLAFGLGLSGLFEPSLAPVRLMRFDTLRRQENEMSMPDLALQQVNLVGSGISSGSGSDRVAIVAVNPVRGSRPDGTAVKPDSNAELEVKAVVLRQLTQFWEQRR